MPEERKYEILRDQTAIAWNGDTVYRIRRIGGDRELGGYVAS